jgi:hypothetical protein
VLLAAAVTFPLALHPGEWLVMRIDGKVRVDDARAALDSGGSVWDVTFRDPLFFVPPAYLWFGALLPRAVPPIVAHNAFMFLCVALASLAMYAYASRLQCGRVGAAYAALLFAASNYLIHHIIDGHAHVAVIFLIPSLCLALDRTLEEPKLTNSLGLGAVGALLVYASPQYALYAALILPLYLCGGHPRAWRTARPLAFLLIGALLGALLAGYYVLLATQHPSPTFTFRANQEHSVKDPLLLVAPDSEVHVGLLATCLAALGSLVAWRRRQPALLALLLCTAVAGVLMLGPRRPWLPYSWLYEQVPLFPKVRTPLRFVAFLLMGTSVLAGYGVGWLWQRSSASWRGVLAIGIAAATIASHHAVSKYFRRSPSSAGTAVWVVREVPVAADRIHNPPHPRRSPSAPAPVRGTLPACTSAARAVRGGRARERAGRRYTYIGSRSRSRSQPRATR